MHRLHAGSRGRRASIRLIPSHREAFGELGKAAEGPAAIFVRAEDALAAIAPVDDMIPAVGHPDTEGSGSGVTVPPRRGLSILRK